jgi:fatty acid/phospholipid biosynthesis enzyme
MIKISIDAMGGDNSPGDVVKGAVMGCQTGRYRSAVGRPQDKIKAELAKSDTWSGYRDCPYG